MKITPKELQQIIKEEALRLKKRMMLESERDSILEELKKLEECEDMGEGIDEGLFDMFKQNPEAKKAEAIKIIQNHPSYRQTAGFVAKQNNLQPQFVFDKLVEFLISNNNKFPAGGVQWDKNKQAFVDKTIYKGTAPGMQGAAE